MRPPQRACQPSAFWLASQNSHIVSVAGCQTTMCASLPAAGLAPAGIGTCSKACWSGADVVSSLTRTVGCPPGTV